MLSALTSDDDLISHLNLKKFINLELRKFHLIYKTIIVMLFLLKMIILFKTFFHIQNFLLPIMHTSMLSLRYLYLLPILRLRETRSGVMQLISSLEPCNQLTHGMLLVCRKGRKQWVAGCCIH